MEIKDVELMKLLLDPKRSRIVQFAREKPMTVKELAERLNEKSSRLYYHVKKLEEYGVIKVVETRQVSNLTEKYYQTIKEAITVDVELVKNYGDELFQMLNNVVQKGMAAHHHMLTKHHQTGQGHGLSELFITYTQETGVEWYQTINNLSRILRPTQEPVKEEVIRTMYDPLQLEQKGTFAYIILSFKMDD
ncbi:MAG: ArsR/SmtB family transcription factor [Bacillaceae bacterium]